MVLAARVLVLESKLAAATIRIEALTALIAKVGSANGAVADRVTLLETKPPTSFPTKIHVDIPVVLDIQKRKGRARGDVEVKQA